MNLLKSIIYFNPRAKAQLKHVIKQRIGIVERSAVWHFLGVFTSGWKLRRIEYSRLEQAIQEYLQGWQFKALSMMGRVTLVRTVLSSIHVYLLFNTIMPKTCIIRLEQQFWCFF